MLSVGYICKFFFVKRRKYRESMRVLDASVIGLNQYHTDEDEEEKKLEREREREKKRGEIGKTDKGDIFFLD
jgi:hypothetical protein